MKNVKGYLSLLLLITTSSFINSKHILFDDSFDQVFTEIEDHLRQLKDHMGKMHDSSNKTDKEAIHKAQENLSKIKPDIKEDDNSIIVTFSIDNIDKKSIHTEIKDNVFKGTIPTTNGKVEFSIDENYLMVGGIIEIKKQEEKSSVNYMSMETEYIQLPSAIEITPDKVNVQTKDNQLIISIAKTKGIEIPIKHS